MKNYEGKGTKLVVTEKRLKRVVSAKNSTSTPGTDVFRNGGSRVIGLTGSRSISSTVAPADKGLRSNSTSSATTAASSRAVSSRFRGSSVALCCSMARLAARPSPTNFSYFDCIIARASTERVGSVIEWNRGMGMTPLLRAAVPLCLASSLSTLQGGSTALPVFGSSDQKARVEAPNNA